MPGSFSYLPVREGDSVKMYAHAQFKSVMSTMNAYSHVSGVCVTNKTGFGFDERIYWTFTQLVTTVHKSHNPTGHSTGTILKSSITPLYALSSDLPLCSVLFIIPRHEPTENTVFCCQECVFIGSIPSNECPIVESVCFGTTFIEPLPSNGHVHHNIMNNKHVLNNRSDTTGQK
jgi:hypothetical protein